MSAATRVGALTGAVAARIRLRRQHGGIDAGSLTRFGQTLGNARNEDEMFSAVERSFLRSMGLLVGAVLARPGGAGLQLCSSLFRLGEGDSEAATVALREGHPAGHGTPAIPHAHSLFVPLKKGATVVGVLGVRPATERARLTLGALAQFDAFCHRTALAIANMRPGEEGLGVRSPQEADRLEKALLNSISHNLRSPLASILGSLGTLRDEGESLHRETRRDLLDNAFSEAERLNRLLGNLLDLSRLEAGAFRVRMDPCDVQDVIGAAIEQSGAAASRRKIVVNIPHDLPFVRMDFVLIVQVIVNLLDNAIKYSAEDGTITVEAAVLTDKLRVRVLDCGTGIPESELVRAFEKFNRAGRSGEIGGVGLGLSICKGLVEAHHGEIWAERRFPRGTAVSFYLPHQKPNEPA